jgi:cytosine/adenosine deaminase-related metal-dependent hydrolase
LVYFAKQLFDGEQMHNNCAIHINENGIISEIVYDTFPLESHLICEGIICPAFINAHCHIELSHLKNVIPKNQGLVNFILDIIKNRKSDENIIQASIQEAMEEMWNNGIIFVGDISNTIDSLKCKVNNELQSHTFIELIGFNPAAYLNYFDNGKQVLHEFNNAKLSSSFALHAPYSVSLPLFKHTLKHSDKIVSFHNQESMEENKFFENGFSDFNRLYNSLSIEINHHKSYNTSGLALWNKDLLQYNENIILVHNTYISALDFELIKNKKNIYLCTCPKANIFIENTLPNYNEWLKNKTQICIGTDSLASNNSLSIFDEIKTIKHFFPNIELKEILRWATFNGAKALNISDKYGKIIAGRNAKIVHLKNTAYISYGKNHETQFEKLY